MTNTYTSLRKRNFYLSQCKDYNLGDGLSESSEDYSTLQVKAQVCKTFRQSVMHQSNLLTVYIVQLGGQWVTVTPSMIKKGTLFLKMLPFWQVDIPMSSKGI